MSRSPAWRQIGELPSQQPPDCTSISGPCFAVRRSIAASAASVATTCTATAPRLLEQPERLRVVADEQALRLRVVVEHHLVVLTSDARDFVAAEGRVRGIEVVAVRPHTAGLDAAAHAERLARVTCPHTRAEAVHRVVCNLERLGLVAERGHREHGTEDLLLEDPHLVV